MTLFKKKIIGFFRFITLDVEEIMDFNGILRFSGKKGVLLNM